MTNLIEFKPWPKIARLNREVIVTEKIDGTNAAVGVLEVPQGEWLPSEGALVPGDDVDYLVYAQSRTRIVTPEADNFGFSAWVWENAPSLAADLGVGLHFGEWWGSGIQRGYGLAKGEKRFSLFNTSRHAGRRFDTPQLGVVPVIYEGPFSEHAIEAALYDLQNFGSRAAPEFFGKAEGVVVYHTAANQMFKVTLENDAAPKSLAVAA